MCREIGLVHVGLAAPGASKAPAQELPAEQQAVLARIFAPGFQQQTLCGGFSGSAVVRVSPVDGDPVVVKLDSADNVALAQIV